MLVVRPRLNPAMTASAFVLTLAGGIAAGVAAEPRGAFVDPARRIMIPAPQYKIVRDGAQSAVFSYKLLQGDSLVGGVMLQVTEAHPIEEVLAKARTDIAAGDAQAMSQKQFRLGDHRALLLEFNPDPQSQASRGMLLVVEKVRIPSGADIDLVLACSSTPETMQKLRPLYRQVIESLQVGADLKPPREAYYRDDRYCVLFAVPRFEFDVAAHCLAIEFADEGITSAVEFRLTKGQPTLTAALQEIREKRMSIEVNDDINGTLLAQGSVGNEDLTQIDSYHFWRSWVLHGRGVAASQSMNALAVQQTLMASTLGPGSKIKPWERGKDDLMNLDQLTPNQVQKMDEAVRARRESMEMLRQRNYKAAAESMRRVIEINESLVGKDHDTLAEEHRELAAILDSMHRYEEALTHYQEALRIYEATLEADHPRIALSRSALGLCLTRAGKPGKAERELLRSLADAENAFGTDSPQYLWIRNNVGFFYNEVHDYAKAESHFRYCLEKGESLSQCQPVWTATWLNNLGECLIYEGDPARARDYLDRALDLCNRSFGQDHEMTAATLDHIGFALAEQGDFANACERYTQALAIRRKVFPEGHPDIGKTLAGRGRALMEANDFKAAISDLVESNAIFQKTRGESHPDWAFYLDGMGRCFCGLEDFGKARDCARRALKIRVAVFGEKDPLANLNRFELGVFSLFDGDLAGAETEISAAVSNIEDAWGKKDIRLAEMYKMLGTAQAALRKPTSALKQFDRSQRVLRDHALAVLPALPLREQLLHRLQLERQFNAGLAYACATMSNKDTAARSAEWLINNKAMVHEALAQQVQLQHRDADNPQAKQILQMRLELSTLAMASPLPEEQEQRAEKIKALEERESDLARRLAAELGIVRLGDNWHDLASIQEHVPSTSMFVDFARVAPRSFQGDASTLATQPERYIAWVVPPAGGDVQLVDLGLADECDKLIESIRTQIDADARPDGKCFTGHHGEAARAVNERLRQLAGRIYEPLAEKLGRPKELILCPDGNLWLVPWAALPIGLGREPLIRQSVIRFVTCGRDLKGPGNRFSGNRSASLMLVDPDYDLEPKGVQHALETLKLAPSPSNGVGPSANREYYFGRLAVTGNDARRMMNNLAGITKSQPLLLTREQALESVVKSAKSPEVLFMHTHGFFLSDQARPAEEPRAEPLGEVNPRRVNKEMTAEPFLRCALVFAGCNKSAADAYDDGYLSGEEILGLDLRGTRLVFLGACETGVGKVRNGEGVAGLRQAFQLAGAEAVVATLWQVNKGATEKLMDGFFENLAKGQSGPEALRNAQLNCLEETETIYVDAHPYFWSALTYTGR